jgi:hypothetical protein
MATTGGSGGLGVDTTKSSTETPLADDELGLCFMGDTPWDGVSDGAPSRFSARVRRAVTAFVCAA